MDHDEMIFQLQQAAISFRHHAKSIRENGIGWPAAYISAETADYHASQLEQIIEHLSKTVLCDTN